MCLFCMSQQVSSFQKKAKPFDTHYHILVISFLLATLRIYFPIQSLCLGPKQAKAETTFQNADLPVSLMNRIPTVQWLKTHPLNHII